MDASLIDKMISCPYCAESMSITLDLSAGGQQYIEDCQVCCQPMQINFESDELELIYLQVDCA